MIRTTTVRRWPRIHHALPWSVYVRRLGYEIGRDNVFGRAAELSYFFLFSVFPLVIVITAAIGRFSEGEQILRNLLAYVRTLMPPAAYTLFANTVQEVNDQSGGAPLSLGILLTLASASSGMVAVIEGLNTAYEVREARAWWKRRLVALMLTLGMAVFGIVALALMLYGNLFGTFVADKTGLGPLFGTAWPLIQWTLMAVFALLAFAIVYRYAPNVHEQHWRWILPGAIVAFVVWLLASFGLRLYLHYFVDMYSRSYGSLGALIALMIWFYLFGAAILIGGETNSIVEQTAARAGNPEAKLPGEKSPGESGS